MKDSSRYLEYVRLIGWIFVREPSSIVLQRMFDCIEMQKKELVRIIRQIFEQYSSIWKPNMNVGFAEMKFVWIEKKKKVSFIRFNRRQEIIISFHLEFLQDIVEVLIYILLPANEFRCVPARMIIRVNIFTSAIFSSLSLSFCVCFKGNRSEFGFNSIYWYVYWSRCDQSIDY